MYVCREGIIIVSLFLASFPGLLTPAFVACSMFFACSTASDKSWGEKACASDKRLGEKACASDKRWGEKACASDKRWEEDLGTRLLCSHVHTETAFALNSH